MRNFIFSLANQLMFEKLDLAAACVCAALPVITAAIFCALRIVRAPHYLIKAKCARFVKKHGVLTAANARTFGAKVFKRRGELKRVWEAELAMCGADAACRAAARAVGADKKAQGGAYLACAAAGVIAAQTAFAVAGYTAAGAATAAGICAVLWIACGIVYAAVCAAARVWGRRAGKKAAACLTRFCPAALPAPATLRENKAFVPASQLDALCKQVEEMLNGGMGTQTAALLLGGLESMLDCGLYCGEERLRLSALRERVKKICA